MHSTHPSIETLRSFAIGELTGDDAETIESHFIACDSCRRRLDELPPESQWEKRLQGLDHRHDPTIDAVSQEWVEVLKNLNPTDALAENDLLSHLVPSRSTDELGRLGRYRILARLGSGAMGHVFKARHPVMDRLVALKVMSRGLVSDPASLARFEREIRAVAKLHHPNIVEAYDADSAGDIHFLVMEFVDGIDLAKLVRKNGPLPASLAADYMRQAALALDHAHKQGLVHRDVKPANLLLAQEGQVKLLDLGLARLRHDSALRQQTTVGSVIGTPDYMAPEQGGDPRSVDIRADIYSLGCTFYFLLTGHVPFPRAGTVQKLVSHQIHQPEPLSRIRPDVSADLIVVIDRMMAKEPDQRFTTPAEVAQALAEFQAQDLADSQKPDAQARNDSQKPEATAMVDPQNPSLARRVSVRQMEGSVCEAFETRESDAPPTFVRSGSWHHRWHTVLASFILGGLLVGVGEVVLRTKHGTLIVSVSEPDVRIVVDGEEKLTIDSKKVGRIELIPGQHQLIVQRGDEELFTQSFTLKSGGEVVLVAQWMENQAGNGTVTDAPPARSSQVAAASPLDQLDPSKISASERVAGQPTELVAVLGEHRWRHWGQIGVPLAYSPDGGTIASAGLDGYVRLWDVSSGHEKIAIKSEVPSAFGFVAFLGDQKTLATSAGGVVRLWDVVTGREQQTLPGRMNGISALAASPDRLQIAAASNDGTIKLWEQATLQERATLNGHTGAIRAIAFTADGKTLASAGQDQTIKLWDVAQGQERTTLRGHTGEVVSLAFLPDSETVVSAANDYTIRFWNVATATEKSKIDGLTQQPLCLALSPNGQTLLSSDHGGTIRAWDPSTAQQRFIFDKSDGTAVRSMVFSPDGQLLASAGSAHTIQLWDPKTGQQREPRTKPIAIFNFALSPSSHSVAIINPEDGFTIKVWDFAAGKEPLAFRSQTVAQVNALAFSPDNQFIATASHDRSVQVWDAATGQERVTCSGHTDAVWTVAFSSDGKTVASAGDDLWIRTWDSETGALRSHWQGHQNRITALAFSPDGKLLASATTAAEDQAVRVWDADSGTLLLGLKGPEPKGTFAITFSPDSQTLAVACKDGTVRLWDVPAGQERFTGRGHEGHVMGVSFAPDGKSFYTAGWDGRVIHWLSFFEKREYHLPGPILGLAASADGRHLVTANGNGTVYVLRLGTQHQSGR